MSNENKENITPEEVEEEMKPSFDEWMDKTLMQREGNDLVRANTLYYGLRANMAVFQQALRKMAKEDSGKFDEDSPDFEKTQKEWHYMYNKIIILRSFAIHFYDLPMPLLDELMPEHIYCGTLMHKEDFAKYMQKPPEGFKVMKPESAKDYDAKSYASASASSSSSAVFRQESEDEEEVEVEVD